MENDPLLEPIRLGSLTLPNRVVMTTIKLGYAMDDGEVTKRHVAFYVRRAEGDIGLMTTEPLYIRRDGRELPTQLGVDSDVLTDGLSRLVDAAHRSGGRIMAHINHAGRAVNPRLVAEGNRISASDVECPATGIVPRSLTRDEIAEVIADFASAARWVREAGFDALEVAFSHGYLIHQFLSPHSNRRTDEYGGALSNRLRFGREVIQAVRAEIDREFPLVVRLNATDYVEGGLTIHDALELAPAIESMGVDALSITSGTMCESVPFCLYPTGTPQANLLPMAARIREVVSIPIIVAGRIRTPDTARQALAEGQTDLVGLARPLLADPDWVKKCEVNDEEAILLCAACHQGCLAELREGRGTGCAYNPTTGRESEVEIQRSDNPRSVVVVGGGPAGMEAARLAAERGHRVVLYEKDSQMGGQLRLAAAPPYKEGFLDVIRFQELMVRRAGVEIHSNTEFTADMAETTAPDVLIVATGSEPLTVPFPGLDRTTWMRPSDVLDGIAEVSTKSALVIGGGLVGLEVADFLSIQGREVTVVEMLHEVGTDMDMLARTMITRRLEQRKVSVYTGTTVLRFSETEAIAERDGEELALPCEAVVVAVGMRPNRALADALAGADQEIYVIGDADKPRNAADAVREGFELGCRV